MCYNLHGPSFGLDYTERERELILQSVRIIHTLQQNPLAFSNHANAML